MLLMMFLRNLRITKSPRSRHRKRWIICIVFMPVLGYYFYSTTFVRTKSPSFDLVRQQQYFIESYKPEDLLYFVNTSSCKIVNISLWADWALPYLQPDEAPKSCLSNRAWTYTNESTITINETALQEYGFSLQNIECCYRIVKRVDQSLDNFDSYADRTTTTSKDCIPLRNSRTNISEEYIRVQCISKAWPMQGDVLYRHYHALFQPEKNEKTINKIKRWKDSEEEIPPNVFILGIDSMSNANFGRTMPKTKQVLIDMGASEFLGYTKVGYNTFPNMVPGLAGYSVEDFEKVCFYTDQTPFDACPFIWKRFDSAGYLTSHIEDGPLLNMLNYEKTGFVKQQVDYYLRPFMYTVYGKDIARNYNLDCIGSKTVDQTIYDYIESMFNTCPKVPLFVFTWMTDLAHGDMNKPKFSDEIYENFFKSLNLNNTILFFVGDHGTHFGYFPNTFNGWFEERTPNFWIYLPPKFRKKYSSWFRNIDINSRRLSSTFDLYHSLNHLLEEFSHLPPVEDSLNRKNETVKRKYGQSIFEEIPEDRTCADAGIGDDFCICSVPVKIELDRRDVKMAAQVAVGKINSIMPPQCAQFNLTKIHAAASRGEAIVTEFVDMALYTVVFVVEPGNFLFEAAMEFHAHINNFLVKGSITRVSRMNTDRSCVKDYKLEVYCYCL